MLRHILARDAVKYIIGGTVVGIPLYSYHRYTQQTVEMSQFHRLPNVSDEMMLETTFKTRFFYKLYNMDFTELKRTEVWIELFLLSLPAVFAVGLSYKAYFRQSQLWKNKHFYDSINVSLNTVIPVQNRYALRVRTILETNIKNVIPNQKGVQILLDAAKKTTESQPFIIIDDNETRRAIFNLFKDHILQLSNQVFIARDILDDAHYGILRKYIMFMTVWPQTGPNVFNKKIRIQLVKKESLRKLISELGTDDKEKWTNAFNSGFFEHRWSLLQFVANEFQNEERNNFVQGKNKYITQVELAMIDAMKTNVLTNISATQQLEKMH